MEHTPVVSDKQLFPQELLNQPIDKRLAYFEQVVLAHPHLVEVRDKVTHALLTTGRPLLIGVVGPAGAGKTTLCTLLLNHVLMTMQSEMERDPGYIPAVRMRVFAPEYGGFPWDDYYHQALVALDEPLIAEKLADSPSMFGSMPEHHTAKALKLRWALEHALHYRRILAFLLDEAQHLYRVVRGKPKDIAATTLYSLARTTNTTHVLFGSYALLELMEHIDSADQRVALIHFPRYRWTHQQERRMFEQTLYSFQCYMPFHEMPDLVGLAEYLYGNCLGCVGTLKPQLLGAYRSALQSGSDTLTRAHLEQHALGAGTLLRMTNELRSGEAAIQARERRITASGGRRESAHMAQPAAKTAGRQQQRRVGERRPTRDKVGR